MKAYLRDENQTGASKTALNFVVRNNPAPFGLSRRGFKINGDVFGHSKSLAANTARAACSCI